MNAQDVVKKSDFTNTDWFSQSNFSDLLAKDTITIFSLIKLNGKKISGKKLLRKYIVAQYDSIKRFDTLVLMDFKNTGKLALDERILSKNDQNLKSVKWSYDEKDRVLSFITDEKITSYQFMADLNLNTKLEDERNIPLKILYKEIKFYQIKSHQYE